MAVWVVGNVGQCGRPISTRHREHLRYIRNNSSTSAYATHILDNRHEFGPAEETLKLLKPCSKGSRMDCWESLFIHLHHKHEILIDEQQANDNNPLFELASIPRDLMQPAWHSTQYTLTKCTTHTPSRGNSDFIHLYPRLFLLFWIILFTYSIHILYYSHNMQP